MSRHSQISGLTGHRDRKGVETRGPVVPQNLGHRDSWISQIRGTECHGSPEPGNTWLHSPPKPGAPLDLATQRPAPTPPKTRTTRSLGPSQPRSRPPNPGAVPGPHRPLLVTGRRHLGGRRSACPSLWFPRTPQRAATERSGGQSGPRGSSSLHFRLPFRLRRPLPWGPRWRRRVSARGGGRGGDAPGPPGPGPPAPSGVWAYRGGDPGSGVGSRDRGRGGERGPGGSAMVAVGRGGGSDAGPGGAESDPLIPISSPFLRDRLFPPRSALPPSFPAPFPLTSTRVSLPCPAFLPRHFQPF